MFLKMENLKTSAESPSTAPPNIPTHIQRTRHKPRRDNTSHPEEKCNQPPALLTLQSSPKVPLKPTHSLYFNMTSQPSQPHIRIRHPIKPKLFSLMIPISTRYTRIKHLKKPSCRTPLTAPGKLKFPSA
jgi:hypothetical protein